jgi:glycosyltransferase involved in cell wall biosynthesis
MELRNLELRHLPSLSVLMPVFNAERYLATAIESVLAQTVGDFEFVAVDDGSRDRSPDILRSYAERDRRLRIVTQPNKGVAGSLNAGLAHCRGALVFRMDADDIALPTRFAAQIGEMERRPGCVALGTAVIFTDPEARPLKLYRPRLEPREIEAELLDANGGALVHPTVVFRRAALVACGGYREEYDFIEDLDLFLRLLAHGELRNLPEPHLHYRQHAQSVNHRLPNREARTAELIAPHRANRGLPPWPGRPTAPAAMRLDECRRRWALDAAEGGHLATARANARAALRHAPFNRRNWACLRYVWSLRSGS